jgi:hypothetical protein
MIRIRHAAAAGCVAAALAAGAVPAQADTVATASASAVANRPALAGEPQEARAQQRADEERLICARIELPARRVRPRICRTRAQWENMGGLPER